MTPAWKALLGYAKAWTYPILGNEPVGVLDRLFKEAGELAKDVAAGADDPPAFAEWLKTLRDFASDRSKPKQLRAAGLPTRSISSATRQFPTHPKIRLTRLSICSTDNPAREPRVG
jgi:hypothetical protein